MHWSPPIPWYRRWLCTACSLNNWAHLGSGVLRAGAYLYNRFWRCGLAWFFVLLITLLGFWLRYWRLDQQGLWCDESFTINRICGTWSEVISSLSDQGFPPLWYLGLRWWLDLGAQLGLRESYLFSAEYLRLPAVIFGAAAPVAFYLLGRAFFARRWAVLLALLAAVNPFLIYYSRDVKMYAALYTLAAFSMAFFMQWQSHRSGWWWAWPLFTLSTMLMMGIKSEGWLLIPIQALILLTRPRPRGLDWPLWGLTVALAGALPLWWYQHNTGFVGTMVAGGYTGLEWMSDYTKMSWTTVLSLPTVQIFGFLLPRTIDAEMLRWFGLGQGFEKKLTDCSWDWLVVWQWRLAYGLLVFLIVALIPWRRWLDKPRVAVGRVRGMTGGLGWLWLSVWIVLPMALLALTWAQPDSYWYKLVFGGKKVPEMWEPRYLGIIIPAVLIVVTWAVSRLPWLGLRILAGTALVALALAGSLMNHITYRQNPWLPTTSALSRYYRPDLQHKVAIALPYTRFANETNTMALLTVLNQPIRRGNGLRTRAWDDLSTYVDFSLHRASPAEYREWARRAKDWTDGRVLIMTDDMGENERRTVGKPQSEKERGTMANGEIQKILGPDWVLMEEQQYRWHYEWRYYFFTNWRTRVWVRKALVKDFMAQRQEDSARPMLEP